MQLEVRVLVYKKYGKPGKTSRGKILEIRINLGETATHSCYVPSEMLNEANARYSPK